MATNLEAGFTYYLPEDEFSMLCATYGSTRVLSEIYETLEGEGNRSRPKEASWYQLLETRLKEAKNANVS